MPYLPPVKKEATSSREGSSPELLLCGTDTRKDVSQITTISVISNRELTDIYPIFPHNMYLLFTPLPSIKAISQ